MYYQRIKEAIQALINVAREVSYFSETLEKNQVSVATPEEASGWTVDATIFLCGHRRQYVEKYWYSGHAGQQARRYAALTRATDTVYLILEGPKGGNAKTENGDKFWNRVAHHFRESQLWFLDDTTTTWYIRSLGWKENPAEELLANCKKLYDWVEWDKVRDSILRSHKQRSDGRSFFNDPDTMKREHSILHWDNRRMAPKMPEGTRRRMDITDDSIQIDQLRHLVDHFGPCCSLDQTLRT